MRPGRAFSFATVVALLGAVASLAVIRPDLRMSPSEAAVGTTWAAEERDRPEEAPTSQIANPEPPPAPAGNPLWTLPLKRLSMTRARPIFSPSRRPPLPAQPRVAPVAIQQPPVKRSEPDRPAVSLVGTVIGTAEQIGIFIEAGKQNAVRLRVGEDHQGWVLRQVNGREATLVKDGEQPVVLELRPGEASEQGRAPLGIIPLLSRENSADEQPTGWKTARGRAR